MRTTHQIATLLIGAAAGIAHADLIGVNYSTGQVFSISTTDASATSLGHTNTGIMGLDRDATGSLLAITDGIAGKLGVLDEATWQLNAVGNLGAGFTFEGSLAVDPSGDIFGSTRLSGSGRAIFQIDPLTGAMGTSVTLSRTVIDLNGLAFRSDGTLVGIDAAAGDFVSIDTDTGAVTSIAALLSPNAGAVGALAIEGGIGYYTTAGTTSGSEGDNSLYQIDLFTGHQSLVGSLGNDAGTGFGIGALAGPIVPAPATLLAITGAGLCTSAPRRRRQKSMK